MAKEELIELEGLVTEILPDTRFRVQLDNGHEIIAYRPHEEESDQDAGGRSGHGRDVALRSRERTRDFPAQG